MKLDFSSVWQYWPFLYHGALTTLKITAMAAVLGFILGVLLSLIKISKCKPLVWFGNFYTSIFRVPRFWYSSVSCILAFRS